MINNVSDTSIWVAEYRAQESESTHPLFKDLWARHLVGDRGPAIAHRMAHVGQVTRWTVIVRTVIIDELIQQLIKNGEIDTVINLGAGLDTRPYRMSLPKDFRWIEVDYPHVISYKEEILREAKASCQVERYSFDLADDQKRKSFFSEQASRSQKVLVLTEGVVIYLTEDQVASLANDLATRLAARYWIVEYISRQAYVHFKVRLRVLKEMNAPFQFFPDNWTDFFKAQGWKQKAIVYAGEKGAELGRPFPLPKSANWLNRLLGGRLIKRVGRLSGYMVLERV